MNRIRALAATGFAMAWIAPPAGATILAPGYAISEILTSDVPVGGLAVVGEAFFFGLGPFGGATQSVVRLDAQGTTTIADGFNGVAGFAYDAVNDRLLVGDNFQETPGSQTGDTIYAIPDPLGAVGTPPSASSLEALPLGSVPSSSPPIKPRVSSVRGTCKLSTSLRAQSISRSSTLVTPEGHAFR